ncbi:hypothetical protein [Plantactinospora sp. B24E8]|uniref:hypothetical protein n=1 Tax=Plantactinospora sp. B24E8 TaxID=3153567 RepID=UPI00325F2335
MTTTTNPSATKSGRGWAYLGATLGGAVSIAANIAHSYVPPAGAPTDWTPLPGAVVGAIFWPVALFVAVEILARVPWPTGRGWTLLRFGGLLPVALVAAVVSYKHLAGLLDYYGEDPLTVAIGPLAVDGLMVMATGALLATGTRRPTTPNRPTPVDTHENASADTDTLPATQLDVVDIPPAAVNSPTPVPAPMSEVPTHLIPTARFVVVNHEQTTGRPIGVDELAARLDITPADAGRLLAVVQPTPARVPATVNGTPLRGDAR